MVVSLKSNKEEEDLCRHAVGDALGRNRGAVDALEYGQREGRPLVKGSEAGSNLRLTDLRITQLYAREK